MALEQVVFQFSPSASAASVRELTGFEERGVEDASTASALRLLARVAVTRPGAEAEGLDVAALPARERDRLLATVYRQSFGDRVESTTTCVRCRSTFEIAFSLRELAESLDAAMGPMPERLSDGRLQAAGLQFRLPSGADECAVAGLPPDEAEQQLLAACGLANSPDRAAAVQEIFERVAPVLDLDLTARCPDCGASQAIHFDIQSYLLGALVNERGRLIRDVHRLALAYGWSLQEILSLTRSERRQHVDLVDGELARRRRG